MNLTKSSNPNSIVLGSAKIEVSMADLKIDKGAKTWSLEELQDLGLARGIKVGFASSKIEIKADNGDVPIKGITGVKGTVEFSLLERDIPTLGKVMGGLVHVSVEGDVPKKHTENIAAGTLSAGTFTAFAKQNFDLSEVQNVVVKQGSKTLTKGSDYTISSTPEGRWGLTFKSGGAFDPAKATSLEYDVAGVKSYTLTKGSGGIATPLSMRLTSRRLADNGKTLDRTYEFPYGFYNGEDSVTFKSKNDGDNVVEVPMKFEFTPHPDLLLDKDMEKSSLYREIQEAA